MPGNFVAAGRVHHVETPGTSGKVFKVTLVSEKTNRRTGQMEPVYVTVTMFSGHGARAQPGAYLIVFGTLEGRQVGERYYTELVAESVEVPAGASRPSSPPPSRQAPPRNAPPASETWDEGVPF